MRSRGRGRGRLGEPRTRANYRCRQTHATFPTILPLMFVSEIFHSIQGEGELTGIPSVFVRTSGCNLRCGWCDTKYASWQPEGEEMSIDRIVSSVLKYSSDHCVLTGGEPMIAKGIHELAAKLRSASKHI